MVAEEYSPSLAGAARIPGARVQPFVDGLLVMAFAIDLVTPFFTWKGLLPDAVSWVSQALTAAVVGVACTWMLYQNRIPKGALAIAAIAAVSMTTAIFRGQGASPTLWGWWLSFRFPLVGLYAYLRDGWGAGFSRRLARICLGLVSIEALFQVGQYLSGQRIGDNLAGTFGWHGVNDLLFLLLFSLSVALGEWLAHGRWVPFLLTLSLGGVSAVLAELKIFAAAAPALALLAVALLWLQRFQVRRVLMLATFLALAVLGFREAYNQYVPWARRLPLEQIFLDEEGRNAYLNKVKRSTLSGSAQYRLGRNGALEYAVSTVSADGVTLLFGYGIGTARSSASLGTSGLTLRDDSVARQSNLVVIVQEMGLSGVLVAGCLVLWLAVTLMRDIRRRPCSPATRLRYGLLLFSILWPLWLWYKNPTGAQVAMILYWVSVGYVLSESHAHPKRQASGGEAGHSHAKGVPR